MKKNSKIIKGIGAIMACALLLTPTTAFAASTNPDTNKSYENSIASTPEDIAILDDSQYSVTGKDSTQDKSSKYSKETVSEEVFESKCDVYGTIAEGSNVYDPDNPNADEGGFVNGQVVIGVPVEIVISGIPDEQGYYKGEGTIKVKGNIAGTTVINVIPDETVTLSQKGKEDIMASIEQTYEQFVIETSPLSGERVNKNVTAAFNDKATSLVEVKTNQATAGSWSGEFTYSIYTTNI